MGGFRPIVLGRITGLFGVAGWVKVYSDTRPVNEILEYSPWYLGSDFDAHEVLSAKPQGKTLIAQLADWSGSPHRDRDSAATLVGLNIAVDRDQLPELPGNQYYWCDLIGSAVHNQDGVWLGAVSEILETGAHDVMVLSGDCERLIPFVLGPIVKRVDVIHGRIDVDWDADWNPDWPEND